MASEPVRDPIARPNETGGTCRRRNEPAFRLERKTAQPLVGTLSTEASKICPIEASNCA
jgi:hypothetical protein